MSKRRRYHTRVPCGGCGRLMSDQEIASHTRACAAWRKRLAEDPELKEELEDEEAE